MTQPERLTKPIYSEKHFASFYKDSREKNLVTPCGVTYFYINGNSRQFRTIILFKEPRHTLRDISQAAKEVKAIDPKLTSVKFVNYARENAFRVVQ